MDRRSTAFFFLCVGAAALALRILFLVAAPRIGIDPLGNPDAAQYEALARALADGRGYAPDARNATEALFRPPLYPAFLAGIYTIAGRSIPAILAIQALFGAASACVLACLARRRFGAAAGWTAGAVAAAHPLLILPGGEILTESLFTILYLGSLFAFARAMEEAGRGGWRSAAVGGVLFGLAILTRPTPLAALPILGLALAWGVGKRFGTAALLRAVIFVAAALLAVAPWVVGSHARHGVWVPIATTGEFTLYLGNAPGWAERVFVGGEAAVGQPWDLERYREIPATPPGGFARKARAIVRDDPGRFLRLTAIRAVRFLKIVPEGKGSAARRALGLFGYTILFPLGVAGLFLAAKRRDALALTLIPVFVAMIAVHAVSIPSIRYRVALIDAVLPVFAGMLVAEIVARARGRSAAGSSVPQPRG